MKWIAEVPVSRDCFVLLYGSHSIEENKRALQRVKKKEKKMEVPYYKGRRCLGNDMTRLSCTLGSMICIRQMGMLNLSGGKRKHACYDIARHLCGSSQRSQVFITHNLETQESHCLPPELLLATNSVSYSTASGVSRS